MEPMEPMRVLPVYSYWPIVLNRFDLLFALLFAFLSRSHARRLFPLLLLFPPRRLSSSTAQALQLCHALHEKHVEERIREKNEDEEEEEEKDIEQDRGGNFIARANQTREGWTEGEV